MAKKTEYQVEIAVNASPKLLYNFLATPSGLSEWFADNVNLQDSQYTFEWDGSEETATLINKKPAEFIRFKWEDDNDDDTFFEFKIQRDGITKDVSLIITDYAEKSEIEDAKQLWESQVNTLLQVIGG